MMPFGLVVEHFHPHRIPDIEMVAHLLQLVDTDWHFVADIDRGILVGLVVLDIQDAV